ncbi:MAG: isoprenylcysteine carboxylmethyltransferase family protein [Gemmatimonadetes bacterium]|nr:isoprenylcysteine carboxylmethyltransferase family protein [Gemmatimonadota bacterium]
MSISLALLILGSAGLVGVSRHSLMQPRAHGFYRFLAWELMLVLLFLNWRYWFVRPFAPHQVASWLLLFGSIPLAVEGVRLLRGSGAAHARARSAEPELFGIERTTSLVTTGIYHYIRHPMYASLLALTWGIMLKHPTIPGGALAAGATVLLYVTAKLDEAECRRYFGEAYVRYMAGTRMFVPFIC